MVVIECEVRGASALTAQYKRVQGTSFTDFATGTVHEGVRHKGNGVVMIVDGPNTEAVGLPEDPGLGMIQSYRTTLHITYIDARKVLPLEKDFKQWRSKQN